MQGLKTYSTLKGTTVTVCEEIFDSGAEGNIHKIAKGHGKGTHCVKLFKETRTNTPLTRLKKQEREKRISYMIYNPPMGYLEQRFKICWPVDAVVENGELIGFVMPFAPDSIKLYHLCKVGPVQQSLGKGYSKYDRNSLNGSRARLQLCKNLATAIYRLHAHGRYTIVDLKPTNILVSHDGKISIIDCDSIQIAQKGNVLFKSGMCTPEYLPPEFRMYKNKLVDTSWDLFALAVIFYQILFGIHPYTATFAGRYDGMTIQERISEGLFVHGGKAARHITNLAAPHSNFSSMPTPLQTLFRWAFENEEYKFKYRPNAKQWGEQFYLHSKEPFILERKPFIKNIKTTKTQSKKKLSQQNLKM